MTDLEINLLVNALVQLIVAATLWIRQNIHRDETKQDIEENTELTRTTNETINGRWDQMLARIKQLEDKILKDAPAVTAAAVLKAAKEQSP